MIDKWISKHPAMFIAINVLTAYIIIAALQRSSVNAAPPATSDNCTLVATVNLIEVYYCEPTLGQPFKINTMGFMLNED